MQKPVDRTISFYERAIEWTHHADKVINLVLGYLLAIASVLGFMDVLSNGEVLQYASWLFYVWLAIMGLGIDFQILLVIGRIPDLFRLEGKKKWVIFSFNVAFLLLLCYMSVIIGAVFTQHRDVPGTISQAMQALGINTIAFVYERAALATLLLALMAVDRTMERWRVQQGKPISAIVPATVPDLDDLIERLDERHAQRMQTTIEMITEILIERTIERVTVAQLPSGEQGANMISSLPASHAAEAPAAPLPGEQPLSYGAAIEALYKGNPQLTVREIAEQVGCSLSTANKWVHRLKAPSE
jgi:hypothetical protein